jgi:hypothetical protein
MIEFLTSAPQHAISNLHFYAIGGEIVLDHVLRYESLDEELAQLAEVLGIDSSLKLPRAKSNTRKDRRPYRDVLGPEERAIIETRCALEIDLLGYEF